MLYGVVPLTRECAAPSEVRHQMNIIERGGSTATIYQFPVGGREALRRAPRKDSLEVEAMRAPQIDFGSWYHQEAVEAASSPKQGGKS